MPCPPGVVQLIGHAREKANIYTSYYQVATFGEDQVITWVHSSDILDNLILEYERSLGLEKYGLISHTLVSATKVVYLLQKKQRKQPPGKPGI